MYVGKEVANSSEYCVWEARINYSDLTPDGEILRSQWEHVFQTTVVLLAKYLASTRQI